MDTDTDLELILEAEAHLLRALDELRLVALRAHNRDRKATVMRQLRQRARNDTAPVLATPEPLDLAG